MRATVESPYTIGSVVKAFRVLELFDRADPALSISEISARTGLNRTTALRFCNTLVDLGYLSRRDDKSYSLGIRSVALAHAAAATLELPDQAMPSLRWLRDQTHETVNLAMRDGSEMIYVARLRSHHILGIQLSVGSRIPLYASSLGKAVAAFLPSAEQRALLKELTYQRITGNTIHRSTDFLHALKKIRADGYALNLEELAPGLRGIARPIFDHLGYPIAAVNIAITAPLSSEEMIEKFDGPLRKAAGEISAALGHSANHLPALKGAHRATT